MEVVGNDSRTNDYGWKALERSLTPSLASILRPAGASRWMLPSISAITPLYVENTLRGALAGNHVQAWEMFDLIIDTNAEVASCCAEYVNSVMCKKVMVTPYANEDDEPTDTAKRKAAVVAAALKNMRPDVANDENDFNSSLRDILFARFHGQSVLEIDWYKQDGSGLNVKDMGTLGKMLVPRSTFWVHPVCYAWNTDGRLGLRMALESQMKQAMAMVRGAPSRNTVGNLPAAVRQQLADQYGSVVDRRRSMVEPPVWNTITSQARPSQLMDFPPNKFLLSVDKFKAGTVMGSGSVLRPLAFWWIASSLAADWCLRYAELFGIPFRVAHVPAITSPAKREEIKQMLTAAGTAGYILLNTGETVETAMTVAGGAASSPQAFLCQFANEQIRKVILHQTMSGGVGAGGSKGVGKSFGDTEAEGPKDAMSAVGAKHAESVVNLQFVPYVLNVNFGPDGDSEAPTVSLVDEKVGTLNDMQRDQIGVQIVNVPSSYMRKKYGYPKPTLGEPLAGQDEGAALLKQQQGGFGGGQGGEKNFQQEGGDGASAGGVESRRGYALAAARAPQRIDFGPAAALAAAVAPVRDRLAAIAAIGDPAVQEAALKKALKDMPGIAKAIAKDPTLAEALAASVTKGTP